jgi:hypothetical protein
VSMQRTLVRQILLWLQNRYGAWERNPRGPASRFHDRVHEAYPGFSVTQLECLLSNELEFDSSGQNRYLFLEPIDEGSGIVPVLAFRYNFRAHNAELRLQLALFVPHENDLAAIGCRFETSEGPGTHDFHHAQLFRGFYGAGGQCLPLCPPWLPTSRPAFQLKADDPVTLLVCMVISLYGLGSAGELQQASFANELKPSMQKLCPAVTVPKTQSATTKPTSRRVKARR